MLVDPERRCSRNGVDRALKPIVAEGFHRPALATDDVVMVIAARLGRLVTGAAAGAELEPVDEPQLGKRLQRAVHAREADARSPPPNLLVDRGAERQQCWSAITSITAALAAPGFTPALLRTSLRVLGPGHPGR